MNRRRVVEQRLPEADQKSDPKRKVAAKSGAKKTPRAPKKDSTALDVTSAEDSVVEETLSLETAPRVSSTSKSASRAKGAAASSSPLGARAALEMLEGQGSAVDAVLAAFFAEAGADPTVLFSPMSALLFGGGAGARAFDGRPKQPGLGIARPRGTRAGDVVTEAAHAAVPRSIATALLLHTMFGRASLSTVTKLGVTNAKECGATVRSDLIRRIGAAGAAATARSEVVQAILATAGVAAGGAVTEADLTAALPTDVALAPSASFGAATVYRVPWGSQVPALARGAARKTITEVIAACDARGSIALLSFERGHGLLVPDLEVSLPLSGVPVMRGVPRNSPGTILSAPAPLAVVDRGPDLRVAFGAHIAPRGRVSIITPKDVQPIAVSTPVDVGVREVATAIGATVVVVALEARGARTITSSDAAA